MASEEEEYLIHAAHTQHVERTCEFLIDEMKLESSQRSKIFFVSAKEVAEEKQDEAARRRREDGTYNNNEEETYDSMQSRLREDRKNEWMR